MNKSKFKLITTSIITGLTALLLISTSAAWFATSDAIDADHEQNGLKGSLLTSYFHCGTGKEEDPFVITRPAHWENMIWLHNNIDDFYNAKGKEFDPDKGKGYFFQIGYDLDKDGIKEVYNYTDDGYFNDSEPYSKTTLNLTCFSKKDRELIPLGSPKYPFIGTMNGNDFNVKGFKVVGYDNVRDEPLEDIGIFGYVGPNAEIHNIYFSDYTINTENANINDETQYEYHTPHESDASFFPHVCVGTLAGHVREASCFHDVYINRATMENTKNETTHADKLNSYGYYGVVEASKEGSSMGTGHDYSFKLDSSKVFQYMSQNYSKINNQPIRTRNTEYDNVIYNTTNPDETNLNGDKSLALHPMSSGFSYVTSGMNSYNLVGDDPDNYSAAPHRAGNRNSYQGYNYSLSTLGYQPLSDDSKSFKYEVKTRDGRTPTKDMVLSNESLDEARRRKETIKEERRYFNSSQNRWEYYNLDLYDRGKVPITINMSCNGTYTRSLSGLTSATDYWSSYTQAYLFIDGLIAKQYSASDFKTFTVTTESYSSILGTRYRNPTYTIAFNQTFDTELYMGTHHIALFIKCSCGNGQYASQYFYDAGSSVSVSGALAIPANRATITEGTFTIDMNTPDNYVQSISIDPNKTNGYLNTSRHIENNNVIAGSGETWNDNNRTIIDNSSTSSIELVGYDLINKDDTSAHTLNSDKYNFAYDDGFEDKHYQLVHNIDGSVHLVNGLPVGIDETLVIDDDGNYVSGGYSPQASEVVYDEEDTTLPVSIIHKVKTHDSMWIATMEATKHIDTEAKTVYIADDPIFQGTAEEPGYNPNNIDIVGGGFQFSTNFVTIDGEDNRALTRPVNDSSYYGEGSGVGTKFYSTLYCPDSIVLMLSNVGGFNEDDIMGEITFVYDWTVSNITGDWSEYLSSFKSMCFKKGGTGNNGYAYFQNVGIYEDDYSEVQGSTQWEKVGTMKLRRGVVENAAYCALDKDGKILCGFDINGNQIGVSSTVKNSQIATYVLVCGVKNSGLVSWWPIKVNTRIRSIQFNYTAPNGFGGDFGSVEYRNATDRVENTIFNMYYLCPKNDQYRVTVEYIAYDSGDKSGKYVVMFGYFSSANPYLSVNFYLYKIRDYDLFVNGVQICEEEYTAEGYQIMSSVQIE